MKRIVSNWLDGALMDLRNIEKILGDTFLTPIACFHAQQCVDVSELYIETRSPGDFSLLPNGKPTIEDVKKFYQFSKEVYETIQKLLIQRERDAP